MDTIGTLLIVGGTFIIGLAPLFAFVGFCVADMKGRSKAAWLILCGLFFPLLVLLLFLRPREGGKILAARDKVENDSRLQKHPTPGRGYFSYPEKVR